MHIYICIEREREIMYIYIYISCILAHRLQGVLLVLKLGAQAADLPGLQGAVEGVRRLLERRLAREGRGCSSGALAWRRRRRRHVPAVHLHLAGREDGLCLDATAPAGDRGQGLIIIIQNNNNNNSNNKSNNNDYCYMCIHMYIYTFIYI